MFECVRISGGGGGVPITTRASKSLSSHNLVHRTLHCYIETIKGEIILNISDLS